jgi:hypothetical protein
MKTAPRRFSECIPVTWKGLCPLMSSLFGQLGNYDRVHLIMSVVDYLVYANPTTILKPPYRKHLDMKKTASHIHYHFSFVTLDDIEAEILE